MSAPIAISTRIPGSVAFRSWNNNQEPPDWTIQTGITYFGYCDEDRPKSVSTLRSPSGWRSPQPWYHTKWAYLDPNVFVTGKGSANGEANGCMGIFDHVEKNQFIDSASIEDAAINKALLKLSNQQFDAGENFAEREQAQRLIGDRLERYAKRVKSFRARRPREWLQVKALKRYGKKKVGAIPLSWLEFQYGAVPLLQDIYGAYELMRNIDKENDTFRVTVKGYVSDSDSHIDTNGGVSVNLPNPVKFVPVIRTDRSTGVFVRLDYVMQNPALHELQQAGLVNPVLLAWNLLPYSFVIDWVLPVGNYLQSWTAALGLSFMGGSISTYQKSESTVLTANPLYPSYYSQSYSFGDGYCRGLNFERRVLSSSPAPRVPHFKNPLSYDHFANAMSLIVSALK